VSSSSRKSPSPEPKIYPRHDLAIRTVVLAVAAQVWPLLVALGLLQAVALAWFARSGDSVPAQLAWVLFKTATLGLVGSFALHELGHVAVLKRIRSVTHIMIDKTSWRMSLLPRGAMTARQVVGVAIAGPVACLVVGAILWTSGLDRPLAWWYVGHGIFLLPTFGDGRSLRQSLSALKEQPANIEEEEPPTRF
jgi:hypothetical protein